MGNSFRFWIISSFGVILFLCLIAAWIFIDAINKSNELGEYHSRLKSTRILLLETNKLKEDILMADFNETGFYTSNSSITDKQYWALNNKIKRYIDFFERSSITITYSLNVRIDEIRLMLHDYNNTYKELIYLYKLKGFKNYGLEGKMRNYAHNIYDFDNKDVKFYCLMLRRHEKDFLLRKDLNYVYLFDNVCKKFIDMISASGDIKLADKSHLITQLYFYNKSFKLLARIESRIGVKGKNGFLGRSKEVFDQIASKIESLDTSLRQISELHQEKLKKDTYILGVILVMFLISAIIILTQSITNSVKSISNAFSNYINSGFSYDSITHKRSRIKEFNNININFLKMAKEINIFTNFFKEKVHERTLAINQQKEEILGQQLKIENQYNILLSKNSELSEQKRLLARKNSDIQESLRYAKRIQKAIQPRISQFRQYFSDSFVFYKPRDVVSGDFYLVYGNDIHNQPASEKIMFVASDCTGHGVPGAIMSVLGINTIHKLIQEQRSTDPGFILNQLDKDLNRVLVHGKEESEIVADGMEIAMFAFDKRTYMLEYSIARFSHYLVRNSEVINLDTEKSGIGYSFFEKDAKNFQTRSFQLMPGDCLYLFSDGFADQFGGPQNKKYKKSNIKTLIEKNSHIDMKAQKEIFKQEFRAWKKRQKQVDDVMMIGIRF